MSWRSKEKYTLFSFLLKKEFTQEKLRYRKHGRAYAHDFLSKVHTYQLYSDLARPSCHKDNLSPWQFIERLALARPSNSVYCRPSSSITTSMSRGIRCGEASLTSSKQTRLRLHWL